MCRKKACVLRNRSNTANGDLRRQNFKPHVEAREAEDGRRLLGFHTSEAKEEIRGVGFLNHQSTGNLWQHVVRQPPRMATRVSENGDRTLGFCKSEAKEEICNVGFAKRWRKTNRYEGRLELTVWRGFFFFVNSGGRDNGEKKRERSYVLTLRWFVLCLLIFFWHMSCIRIKIGGNRRNLNWRGSIPLIWANQKSTKYFQVYQFKVEFIL